MSTIKKKRGGFISPGNAKTGDAASFDLPANVTCPGATNLCISACYALNAERRYKSLRQSYRNNLAFSRLLVFVPYMVKNLPSGNVRIHVSGDFYSSEYTRKWIKIAKARPDIRFYAYTRSWRIASIWAELKKLAALPNVNINLSLDAETRIPMGKIAQNMRWCFMSFNDKDVPNRLRKTDLVFRREHQFDIRHNRGITHNLGGVRVCPLERGTKAPLLNGLRCSTCEICIEKMEV